MDRGGKPRSTAGGDGHDGGEGENGRIDLDVGRARQDERTTAFSVSAVAYASTSPSAPRPATTAGLRTRNCTNQPRPRRANRQTHGDFPLAHRGAREQQVPRGSRTRSGGTHDPTAPRSTSRARRTSPPTSASRSDVHLDRRPRVDRTAHVDRTGEDRHSTRPRPECASRQAACGRTGARSRCCAEFSASPGRRTSARGSAGYTKVMEPGRQDADDDERFSR